MWKKEYIYDGEDICVEDNLIDFLNDKRIKIFNIFESSSRYIGIVYFEEDI
jgi:hypothetical protein